MFPLTVAGISFYTDDITKATEYPKYYNHDLEKTINKNRIKIGLSTLDEMREKFFFTQKERKNGGRYSKYELGGGVSPFFYTTSEADIKPILEAAKKRGIKL